MAAMIDRRLALAVQACLAELCDAVQEVQTAVTEDKHIVVSALGFQLRIAACASFGLCTDNSNHTLCVLCCGAVARALLAKDSFVPSWSCDGLSCCAKDDPRLWVGWYEPVLRHLPTRLRCARVTKRLALTLSGGLRTAEATLPYLRYYILDAHPDADVFITSTRDPAQGYSPALEAMVRRFFGDHLRRFEFIEDWPEAQAGEEAVMSAYWALRPNHTNTCHQALHKFAPRMWWRRWWCHQLLEEYGAANGVSYTAVMRSRIDALYLQPLSAMPPPGTLYTHICFAAFGEPSLMKTEAELGTVYGAHHKQCFEALGPEWEFASETQMQAHLRASGIIIDNCLAGAFVRPLSRECRKRVAFLIPALNTFASIS